MKLKRQIAFTLIELIVVISLAGVIILSVLLNTNLINPNQGLEKLNNQLPKLIYFAHQQALLQQQNYALSITKDGYKFLTHDGDKWVVLKDKLLKEELFPESISSELRVENSLVSALPKDELKPHILILASGEMTPFEWIIKDQNSLSAYTLTGTYNGEVVSELQYED